MESSRRGLVALALIGAIASAIRYAPVIDDPWDRSMESIIPTVYYGRVEQTFQRYGFWALGGAPHLYRFPMAPGVADSDATRCQYLRHPVLSYWLNHAAVEVAGWSERSFRIAPILFSSLSAALLVLIIGRLAGVLWAGAGLFLYLALPMSWFVGSMAGYEAFTLAPMLAAFLLHDTFRTAPFRAYAWTWLPVFLAGQMDWIGLAIVPAIASYEMMTPRGAGPSRVRRAASLLVPAAASVLVSLTLVVIWRGSIGAGLAAFLEAANKGTLLELRKWGAADWFASQGVYWRQMFTLPTALVSAAALPFVVLRCRSTADPLPRTALALLVPAILNVIVFREHAFIHDFWWYYALPYVVLSVVIVLRAVVARAAALPWRPARLAPAIILLVLAAFGVERCHARHEQDKTTEFRDQGRDLNRFVNRNDVLLYIAEFDQTCFYLESSYVDFIGRSRLESYAGIRDLKRAGKLLVARVVAVVPDGTAADFTTGNLPRLREIGAVRRLDPASFAAEAPALAHAWEGRGLWVLTIE